MNFFKRAVGAALAATLLMTAACSTADTSWAYRAGGYEPSVGVYIFAMVSASTEAEAALVEQHAEDNEYTPPKHKDMLREAIDGRTAEQFILDEARANMAKFIAVEQKFDELGLALTDTEKASAAANAENSWTYEQAFYEKNGIAQSTLQYILENNLKQSAIFQAMYGPEGSNAVAEDELRDLFARDYARVDVMYLYKGAEEAETAEAKAQAEGYLERLKAGENFYDVLYDYQLDSAPDEEKETVERPEEGSVRGILYESLKGTYYSAELVDGALATPVGEAVVLEDDYYYYVLERLDSLEDEEDFASYRTVLLNSLKSEEFEGVVSGWADSVSLEANQAALDRYQPSKLKVD